MTAGGLLCEGGAALRAAGIPDARFEARLLLSHATGWPAETLLRDPRAPVPDAAAALFRALVARRAAREPLARITGRAGFWTLELEVSPDTLIPRPDSEAVIRLALALSPAPRRVLDLGTGTGCLLLAVLAERPGAWGVGLDLRPGAASLAARNAAANGLGGRAAFLAGDWDAALAGGGFDLVLSNPPYIPAAEIAGLMPEVRLHEPATALDGGADGLDAYRALLPRLPGLLAPGGWAVLEVGEGQAQAVAALGRAAGFGETRIEADFGGISRAVALGGIGGGGAGP